MTSTLFLDKIRFTIKPFFLSLYNTRKMCLLQKTYTADMCFIEKTQYPGWSQEVKEIYDAHKGLRIVLSGSSLVKLNDGDADLSRRMVPYMIPGLSLREYIILEKGLELPSIALEDLLASPNSFCAEIKKTCAPLEYFKKYLSEGYYPYFFESRNTYPIQVENVVDYIVNNELPSQRGLEVGNTRKVKALTNCLAGCYFSTVDHR